MLNIADAPYGSTDSGTQSSEKRSDVIYLSEEGVGTEEEEEEENQPLLVGPGASSSSFSDDALGFQVAMTVPKSVSFVFIHCELVVVPFRRRRAMCFHPSI